MISLDRYILENDLFALGVEAATAGEAIGAGVSLLSSQNLVEPCYYDAIMKAYEEMGAYFVIAPGFAMPHARPEDGVLENCFSLVTLRSPLEFGSAGNDPVKVLITIGAVAAKSMNTEVLVQVAELVDCSAAMDVITKATTKEDLERGFSIWRGGKG